MKILSGAAALACLAWLCGCSTAPIALPANYSTQNFRKIQMGVAFSAAEGVDKKTGEPLPVPQGLNERLQTELAKLKRFTIYSAHNRGGVMYFEELTELEKLSEGKTSTSLAEATSVKDIDVVLSGHVSVSKERHDRYDDTLLIYEVECDVSCEDLRSRTVKFAEKAKGRTARKQVLSFSGMKIAGYSEKDEEQAITQAAMKALAVIAEKLGNNFPAGGSIVGISASGERMQLDIGFENGIGNRQQCVVYVADGGVDVPIALAEAAPGTDQSTLLVCRWNDADADAAALIETLKKSPKQFLKDFGVYAVACGLPVPPEWEDDSADAEDEKKRLK